MRRFRQGERVKVIATGHPCLGKLGTVVRKCIADDSAWIKFDENLPENVRQFPDGDDRVKHMRLYPEDCEAVVQ